METFDKKKQKNLDKRTNKIYLILLLFTTTYEGLLSNFRPTKQYFIFFGRIYWSSRELFRDSSSNINNEAIKGNKKLKWGPKLVKNDNENTFIIIFHN